MWLAAAILSAIFAGLTAILAKCGIQKTDSDVATAIRTTVVLLFSWFIAFAAGSVATVSQVSPRSYLFLLLSGAATGASWLCYFKALAIGNINQVVPVDKSSTVLSILLAIICLGETRHLAVKLVGCVLLSVGIFLMIEKKQDESGTNNRAALLYAAGSAGFAALTSILAKIGISGVESNLGTAIRTAVVFFMAWLIVFARGKKAMLKTVGKTELGFITLSGIATGISWLCYYYAIQNGVVSVVVPIDKMSLLLSIVFSCVFLHEKLSVKAAAGLSLMTVGTVLMAIFA